MYDLVYGDNARQRGTRQPGPSRGDSPDRGCHLGALWAARAVLVSPERYDELMEALDEADDIAAFDAAMAEEGPNLPRDQVKADLGWE